MISVGRIGGGHVVPVTYSYVGYANTDGVPTSDPTVAYGSAYSEWRVYSRSIPAADHGSGTAVAINVFQGTDPTVDEKFVCLYDSSGTLLGTADISDKTTSDDWTGFVDLVEATTDSLNFATDDVLEPGISYKNTSTANFLSRNSSDSSTIKYVLSTDTGDTPPSSITWLTSGSTGLGVILKYIAD